jgi:hypothetical protein
MMKPGASERGIMQIQFWWSLKVLAVNGTLESTSPVLLAVFCFGPKHQDRRPNLMDGLKEDIAS